MSRIAKAIREAAGPNPDLVADDLQEIGNWCGMIQAAEIAEKTAESVDEDEIIEILNSFVYAWCNEHGSMSEIETVYAHKLIDLFN